MQNNSQSAMLFDKKFVANTLREFLKCLKCRNEFSWNYLREQNLAGVQIKSNRPVLLPCGHSICENCVQQNYKNLVCPDCSRPLPVPNQMVKNFKFRTMFELNFYLMGVMKHLCYYRNESSFDTTILLGSENDRLSYKKSKKYNELLKCGECDKSPAAGKCSQCNVNYCKNCFDRVHMNSKVLKAHSITALETQLTEKRFIKPRPKVCFHHRKVCNMYCKKCRHTYCQICIKADHSNHGYITVAEMNQRHNDDLLTVMDAVKQSRENVRKAQREIKSVESQMQDYATQTLEDIAHFFLEMHGLLQLEFQKIVQSFSENCAAPQLQMREAYDTLSENLNILNSMRSYLESFERSPSNVNLSFVNQSITKQLSSLQSEVQISRIEKNPFVFIKSGDFKRDLHNYCFFKYVEPEFSLNLGSPYGNDRQQKMLDLMAENKQQLSIQDFNMNFSEILEKTTNLEADNFDGDMSAIIDEIIQPLKKPSVTSELFTILAQISFVKSPSYFFLQNVELSPILKEISEKYEHVRHDELVPKTITPNNIYMGYHEPTNSWHRIVVTKIIDENHFKTLCIDIGTDLEMSRKNIRKLDEKFVSIAFGAVPCTLHNIEPVGKGWPQDAKELMLDITRGQPVRAYIFGNDESNVKSVDLVTTYGEQPISIRDAFLYMGLAQEKPGSTQTPSKPQKMHRVTPITEQYTKAKLRNLNNFHVKVTHVENPTEFYIVSADQEEMKNTFCSDLNTTYNKMESSLINKKVIYFASMKMCCAVRYKNMWYRGSVEEIEGNGLVRVRFVDEGQTKVVKWNCLYQLEPKFRGARELAARCTLYELEPLQKNNYTWTPEAIKEFNMLISNPNIMLRVDQTIQDIYRVTLLISKKNTYINVGAVLVRKGHAISTGPSTQTYEIQKKNLNLALDVQSDEILETIANANLKKLSSSSNTKKIERVPIKMVHVVNPGEFYVYLASLEEGVCHFHEQLQISQEKTNKDDHNDDDDYVGDEVENKENWSAGDHCLVQTIFRSSMQTSNGNEQSFIDFEKNAEWFRAIIMEISSSFSTRNFTVFLRDKGATIKQIKSNQLRPITQYWDCVANSVQRCHLAYLKPNGASNTWSMSSTDRLKENAKTFHSLLATRQGEPNADTHSMPIFLWGLTAEPTDALGPTVSKYSNINRILLKMGLACQTESSISIHEMNSMMHTAVDSNQISLDEWCKKNSGATLLKALERVSDKISNRNDVTPIVDEQQPESLEFQEALNDAIDTNPTWGEKAPEAWVQRKVISKTLFTAFPSYVNNSAEIFLHEAADNGILNSMRTELTTRFNKIPPDLTKLYSIGQPCVVRYHCDGAFYRGIVISADNRSDDYNVEFVDYGNEETVKADELRPFAPYRNVISFASKYRIAGIRPVGGAPRYPIPALDVMHKLLVDKLVSVRVQTSEMNKKIQRCSIRIGAEDLADILVHDGRAEYKKNNYNAMRKFKSGASRISLKLGINLLDSEINDITAEQQFLGNSADVGENIDEDIDENVMENIQNEIENIDEDEEAAHNSMETSFEMEKSMKPSKQPAISTFKSSDFKGNIAGPTTSYGLLKQMDVMNYSGDELEEDIAKKGSPFLNLLDEPDADVVVLEESLISNYWQNTSAIDDALNDAQDDKDDDEGKLALQWNQIKALQQHVELESSCDFENFKPQDASTTLSHFAETDFFELPILPSKVRSFRCQICSLVSPTVLYIFPHLKEFQDREQELKGLIKAAVKIAKPLANFTTSTLCLARYSIDQNWYRAIIRSYDAEKLEANVLFVDYWNTESVSIKHLKQCPLELLRYPLRVLKVQLHGVKPSLRMRKKDVCHALGNVLEQYDDLFVQVQKHTAEISGQPMTKELIEVYIFESESSSNVIYYELIKQKFYTPTK